MSQLCHRAAELLESLRGRGLLIELLWRPRCFNKSADAAANKARLRKQGTVPLTDTRRELRDGADAASESTAATPGIASADLSRSSGASHAEGHRQDESTATIADFQQSRDRAEWIKGAPTRSSSGTTPICIPHILYIICAGPSPEKYERWLARGLRDGERWPAEGLAQIVRVLCKPTSKPEILKQRLRMVSAAMRSSPMMDLDKTSTRSLVKYIGLPG